ncbi:MAG: hemolysin family protein [Flexilinea sp.]
MNPGSCTSSELDMLFLIILVVIFVFDLLLAAIYSAYKTARDSDLFIGSDEKRTRKSLAARLIEIPRVVEVLRISSRISSITFTAMAVIFALKTYCLYFSAWFALLISVVLSLLIMLLEAMIGGLASHYPEAWASRSAGLCQIIVRVFDPIYALYRSFTTDRMNYSQAINEVETHLRDWVENVPENAVLKKEERKMMRSILHFSDTLIREIMIPRVDMVAIDVDSGLDEAAEMVLSSGHSRLPVYEDEIDNIIGVLYAKDLLKIYLEQEEDKPVELRLFLRQPLFVPEAKKAGDLLTEMQTSGTHMVVVVDEYGGTAGIVSMEDIVEEIVGEIRDEYDESEEQLFREVGPDQFSFLGRIDLEDVNEYLGTHITRETADTLAGFMYSQIGKVPSGDEKINVEGWIFCIEELSGNRIRRVYVKRTGDDDPQKEEKDESE